MFVGCGVFVVVFQWWGSVFFCFLGSVWGWCDVMWCGDMIWLLLAASLVAAITCDGMLVYAPPLVLLRLCFHIDKSLST